MPRAGECGGGRRAGGFSLFAHLFVIHSPLGNRSTKMVEKLLLRARATHVLPKEVSEAGENFQVSQSTRSLS
jgi:hypothetical protein